MLEDRGFFLRPLHTLAAGMGLLAASFPLQSASAETYPDKPVTIVISGAAGGGIDLSVRLSEPKISEILGQPIVVQNQPGASGNTGASYVVRSQPDGYTLLAIAATHTVNPSVMEVNYDIQTDLTPISRLVQTPSVLVSHPSVDASDLEELIAYANENPGALTYGSAGAGSMPHLQMALFLDEAGIDMLHVPYASNGEAISDVLAGHIDMLIVNTLVALPHIQAGRLKPYGVTSAERVDAAPDIPTLSEAGVPGYEAIQWFGLVAPAGTPEESISIVHQAVVEALADPEVRERFERDGVVPAPSESPAAFGEFISAEIDKWARVAESIGLRAGN